METETLTYIAIIAPMVTGALGIIIGHYLALTRIDSEISKLTEKDRQAEKRHREEKFENAIQYWGILGNYSTSSKDTSIYEKFYFMKCKERKDLYIWLKENQINEVCDFIYWLDKKIPTWQVTRFLEPIKR